MNLNLIAADLAKRVPDMAQDSVTNNEQLILSLLKQSGVQLYADPQCGVALIDRERERQVAEEGWTPEHDNQHKLGELCSAAVCYTVAGDCLANAVGLLGPNHKETPELLTEEIMGRKFGVGVAWPWGRAWLKISENPIRNLVKAGALIVAEIDRLQRLTIKAKSWNTNDKVNTIH